MYQFMPVIVKKDKNEATGMPDVFRTDSNLRMQQEWDNTIPKDHRLKHSIALVSTKLNDKFPSMA